MNQVLAGPGGFAVIMMAEASRLIEQGEKPIPALTFAIVSALFIVGAVIGLAVILRGKP